MDVVQKLINTALGKLIVQVDAVSFAVLVGLFFLSVLCVAIITYRFIDFARQKRALKRVRKRMALVKSLSEMEQLAVTHSRYLAGQFLGRCLESVRTVTSLSVLNRDRALDRVELSIGQAADDIALESERYLPVLAISAAVSPLIGLFGTVWGLVHAFVQISEAKSADITVVAPGMAQALTTTLAGLVVAIPALIFFIYFNHS